MKFQLRHFGIEILASAQPRCTACGGHMSIHNYGTDWWWSCLNHHCDGPFQQHKDWDFEKWYGEDIRIPGHEMMRLRASRQGLSRDHGIDADGQLWRCIDSPSFGGSHCASRHNQEDGSRSELFWTGYLGQVAEEWVLVRS